MDYQHLSQGKRAIITKVTGTACAHTLTQAKKVAKKWMKLKVAAAEAEEAAAEAEEAA